MHAILASEQAVDFAPSAGLSEPQDLAALTADTDNLPGERDVLIGGKIVGETIGRRLPYQDPVVI